MSTAALGADARQPLRASSTDVKYGLSAPRPDARPPFCVLVWQVMGVNCVLLKQMSGADWSAAGADVGVAASAPGADVRQPMGRRKTHVLPGVWRP